MNLRKLIIWPLVGPLFLAHLVVSVMLFGLAFGLGEGDGAPRFLITIQQVFGAPLFLIPDHVLARIGNGLGDATVFTLFGLNSALWAVAIAALVGAFRKHRERAA